MAIFLTKSQSCYGNSSVKLPLVLSFARIHDSGKRLLKPSGDSPNQTCDADSAERESISEISLNSSIRPSRTSTAHGDMLKDEPQTISPLTSRCTSRKEQGTAGRNKGRTHDVPVPDEAINDVSGVDVNDEHGVVLHAVVP